jgi:hypothetical protein
MSPSYEHEQCRSAFLSGNLASSRSAPFLAPPPRLEISSYRRHNEPLATSSTSVIRLASSSKVPRPFSVISKKSLNTRSAERSRRREMAENLFLARPDLVDPSYAAKRSRRLSRLKEQSVSVMQDMSSRTIGIGSSSSNSISAHSNNGPMFSREFRPVSSLLLSKQATKRCHELLDEDIEDVRQTMDWERSRRLALCVTGALAAGRKASDVLPRLTSCVSRQRYLVG